MHRNKKFFIKKQTVILCVCIFLVALATYYISKYRYQLMMIQGKSMEPAFSEFEIVILNKHPTNYRIGDVIAFYCPELKCVLVKRIVASESDSVLIYDGKLFVNGTESSVLPDNGTISYSGSASSLLTVPENCFFVMGDNYEVSKDSRYEEVGLVFMDDIIGRVIQKGGR